jgi:hypothetical protein
LLDLSGWRRGGLRGEEGRGEMGGWEVGREVGERDWVETHDRREGGLVLNRRPK